MQYVSIRYESEGRTAVAQHVPDFNSPSSGAFLCCMLRFGMSRYVMRVKVELQSSSTFNLITYRDIPNRNIQHKNAPEDGILKSETC